MFNAILLVLFDGLSVPTLKEIIYCKKIPFDRNYITLTSAVLGKREDLGHLGEDGHFPPDPRPYLSTLFCNVQKF